VVVYYVSLLVYPHPDRLILDHDYPLSLGFFHPSTTWTCLVMLGVVAGWAGYLARKDRLLAFAIFWFMITLVIESSVIGIEIIYEHRLYLPVMFLSLAAANAIFQRIKPRRAAVFVLVLCATVLSVWSFQRNRIWATDVAFWSDNAKKSPLKERPYQNLAYSMQIGQKLEDAIYFYRKSLAINPHPVAYFNLGLCLEGIGYYSDAVDAYVDALKTGYNTPQVQASLAGALARIGEFEAALSHFAQAVRMNPEDRVAEKKHAMLRAFLEKCKTPEQCVWVAIAREPDNPALRFKLGMIYEKQGNRDQAFSTYEKVLSDITGTNRKIPRKLYLLVINRMAVLHAMNGDVDASLGLLEKAVATAPDNPFFYYETAAYCGLLGEISQSVSWLDRAVQKGYRNWAQIASDRRLDSIRNTRYVQNLMKMNNPENRLN
jgi:tetratricopeptide (TPR) repeat protein